MNPIKKTKSYDNLFDCNLESSNSESSNSDGYSSIDELAEKVEKYLIIDKEYNSYYILLKELNKNIKKENDYYTFLIESEGYSTKLIFRNKKKLIEYYYKSIDLGELYEKFN